MLSAITAVAARPNDLRDIFDTPIRRTRMSSAESLLEVTSDRELTLLFQFRDDLGVCVERIAGRTDGTDKVGTAAIVERLAQATNVNIDRSRVDIRIV